MKFELFACLLHNREENPEDVNLNPANLRSQTNLKLGFWTTFKKAKDPTLPLAEEEEFLQEIGFPSVNPYDPAPSRPHTTQWYSNNTIPHYLIKDSEEWLLTAEGKYDYGRSCSSPTLSIDAGEPINPFTKINPISRLSQQDQDYVRKHISEWFPFSLRELDESEHTPPIQVDRSKLYRVNRRQKAVNKFHEITQLKMEDLNSNHLEMINENTQLHPDNLNTYSIHASYVRIKRTDLSGRWILAPHPVWIVIVDGQCNIVYETIVHYKEVDEMDTRYHGLRKNDLKFGKNLASVRDQVIQFLASAKHIIGSGLITLFKSLQLRECEIDFLRGKMRDVTIYFSPYCQSPASLSLIAFLIFSGYTIKNRPHSPCIEAILSMRLYMSFWQEIELKVSTINYGIHNRSIRYYVNNRKVSKLHKKFTELVKDNKTTWPTDWCYFKHHHEEPNYSKSKNVTPSNSNSVTPTLEDPTARSDSSEKSSSNDEEENSSERKNQSLNQGSPSTSQSNDVLKLSKTSEETKNGNPRRIQNSVLMRILHQNLGD